MRFTRLLLRRGKPRPKHSMFPDRWRRVPQLLRPMQGGQNMFNTLLLQDQNDKIKNATNDEEKHLRTVDGDALAAGGDGDDGILVKLQQADFAEQRTGTEDALEDEMRALRDADGFTRKRGFNELEWYDQRKNGAAAFSENGEQTVHANEEVLDSSKNASALLPDRVMDNEYFKNQFGYSLVKDTELPVTAEYSQLDLWGELPKYTRNMYFLYIISRRRNTFAVCFNYDGKKVLKTYTVGNRGLRGGDKGFAAEGSIDNGHQVTSMYLNDLLPRIREFRAEIGKPLAKGEKVELVVRLMGFYNGRQGAVRAVTDRSDFFTVRYVEDITPFPLNGPKMPRGVYK